ncbi:hypothetical protein OK006_10644 [Actinobacteria bacterium OK006]|nr:hypothetical protein OK006_10644 [Actinobacteria bacterium OK006]
MSLSADPQSGASLGVPAGTSTPPGLQELRTADRIPKQAHSRVTTAAAGRAHPPSGEAGSAAGRCPWGRSPGRVVACGPGWIFEGEPGSGPASPPGSSQATSPTPAPSPATSSRAPSPRSSPSPPPPPPATTPTTAAAAPATTTTAAPCPRGATTAGPSNPAGNAARRTAPLHLLAAPLISMVLILLCRSRTVIDSSPVRAQSEGHYSSRHTSTWSALAATQDCTDLWTREL